MSTTHLTTRQRRVLRAVIAIHDYCERCMGGAQPVRAFQVRYFGLPECVTDAALSTIGRDLRVLAGAGLLERERRAAEYVPTTEGRAAIEAAAS